MPVGFRPKTPVKGACQVETVGQWRVHRLWAVAAQLQQLQL